MKKLRVGLIGFGLAGRVFHAPFLRAHGGYEIKSIYTKRDAEVSALVPEALITSDVQTMLNNDDIDLVINCAPNEFHFALTEQALANGKHVVVEKPFVIRSDEGEKLVAQASERGLCLSVFHNRRWDGDFLTVKKLIASGRLGEIKNFESHFDRWRPALKPGAWRETDAPGTGLLYDLGSHLIDQTLLLFGLPDSVTADLGRQRTGAKSDDYFLLILRYGEMRVLLGSTSFSNTTPRFQIFGSSASFTKYGLDPQEAQLKEGLSPRSLTFGREEPSEYGVLGDPASGSFETVVSEPGSYAFYYAQLYDAITKGQPATVPVSVVSALNVIRVIEFANESARTGRTIPINLENNRER